MVIAKGEARSVAALVIVEDVGVVMLEGMIVGMAVCVIFNEAERVSSMRGRGREACKGEAERRA